MATPLSSQFLITSDEVKTMAGLNDNIEARKIVPWIIPAQMCLRSAIGSEGYDAVIATLTTPDSDYDLLKSDYIKPYLAAQITRMSPIPLASEADRNGTFERQGETYRPVSKSTMGMMNASARDMSEILRDVMLQYIYDNRDTFTWWDGSCNTTNYSGGVITRIDHSQMSDEYYLPTDGYPDECCDGRY